MHQSSIELIDARRASEAEERGIKREAKVARVSDTASGTTGKEAVLLTLVDLGVKRGTAWVCRSIGVGTNNTRSIGVGSSVRELWHVVGCSNGATGLSVGAREESADKGECGTGVCEHDCQGCLGRKKKSRNEASGASPRH